MRGRTKAYGGLLGASFALAVLFLTVGLPGDQGCGGRTAQPAKPPAQAKVPLPPPLPAALPSGVQACAILGERSADGRVCAFYDVSAKRFATPDDALLRRVYLYDRYLDLYHSPEGEVAERRLTQKMSPGDPESRFADQQYLGALDDYGDSALWTATAGMAAAFRYAATGTDADRGRLERFARASVSQFDATGMDGYLARFHFEGVATGTPIVNGRAMAVRAISDDTFDIPQSALPKMPDYYREGHPSWQGNPSIDQYSGPVAFYPLAFALLDDAALKARMAQHYACFLKRLRPLHIINLSRNSVVKDALSAYLAAGVLHHYPDEPDLTQIDEIWGFYLPRYIGQADYPHACPAALSFDASLDDTLDAAAPDFTKRLISFVMRQYPDTPQADSMDFAYYPSIRAGDAAILLSAALGAYYLTGDPEFLRWREEMLVFRSGAREVAKTMDALVMPKACTNYFRGHNVSTAAYVGLLLDADAQSKAAAAYVWQRKYTGYASDGDTLFDLMTAALFGGDASLDALRGYGGSEGHLDDPRRNYNVDSQASPLPDNPVAPPSAADVALCQAGFDLYGFHVPGPKVEPDLVLAAKPLPPLRRDPRGFIWEGDPFRAVRNFQWWEGEQEYPGLDLTEPYWLARAHGLVPDPHFLLAWQ